ncbi:MAG: peptidylprolyl isomerase [Candidatus Aenigmarchaeota archaeon]|nr:peptidylprolyl isomerase [Candidatus Aenigmarchaeota archaeon]
MEKGDFVKINYIGRLETGEIFDLTYEDLARKEGIHNPKMKYGPVLAILGAGFVIRGLEKSLEEMKVGEKRSVEIKPEDGFGERNPKLVKVVPEKVFEQQKVEPKQGMVVDFGNGMKGRIQSATGGRVRVDFNNPLAGKTLKYDVEITEKVEGRDEKIKAIGESFGIDDMKAEFGEAVHLETKLKLPLEIKERIIYLVMKFAEPQAKSVKFTEVFDRPASL